MAGGRVFWQSVATNFPEGTPAAHHYTAHLGSVSADEPLTVRQHTFPNLAPGDYQTSVDTVAADGFVIAMQSGPMLHVPTPVVNPVAMNVGAELTP